MCKEVNNKLIEIWKRAVDEHNSETYVYCGSPIVRDYVKAVHTNGSRAKTLAESVGPNQIIQFFMTTSLLLSIVS